MDQSWNNRWRQDDQGNWIMPAIQSEFLDWLISDLKVPSSQKAWAEQNGVDDKTPPRWKKDERFLREWERRTLDKNVGIERIQAVIDVVYKAAVDGDMKAAIEYMRYVERILPPRKVERDPEDLQSMSDAELVALAQGLVGGGEAEPEPVRASVPRFVPEPKLAAISNEDLKALLDAE